MQQTYVFLYNYHTKHTIYSFNIQIIYKLYVSYKNLKFNGRIFGFLKNLAFRNFFYQILYQLLRFERLKVLRANICKWKPEVKDFSM